MRLVSCLLFLFVLVVAASPQKHAGKTCAEILKMGHDQWFDHYTKLKGETTVDMVNASAIYADCLSKRNQQELAKLPEVDRNWIGSQYKIVRKINTDLFSLEARGGGTMYNIIAASDHVRGEEMLTNLIKVGKIKAAPSLVQRRKVDRLIKDSRSNFVKLSQLLKKEPDPQNPGGYRRKDFVKWAYDARGAYEKWVKSLPPTRAAASILMLEYLYDSLLPKNFSEG